MHGSQRIEDTGIEVIDLGTPRAAGVEATMRRALERLAVPDSTASSGSISLSRWPTTGRWPLSAERLLQVRVHRLQETPPSLANFWSVRPAAPDPRP